jgi:autotransporter-associated beta strand protein
MTINQRGFVRCMSAVTILILNFISFGLHAATHTWTGASGDGKWSTAFNWSGGVPVAGEAAAVILVFPPAGSKFTTNDIANLTVDQIQVTGDNYVIAATGAGVNVTLRSQVIGSSLFITGANAQMIGFVFNITTSVLPDASVTVSPGDTATLRCRFAGAGGLKKLANGTLILSGTAANTYSGRTWVQGGTLKLSQTGNAIPGDLEVGYPGITNLAEVLLLTPNQVADAANVQVNRNGAFRPDLFSETVTSITLSNANLVAGVGLTLTGSFTSIGTNTVTGKLRLGGGTRSFDVTGWATMDVFIEDGTGTGGLIKTGPGVLELKRSNTFTGTVSVNEGTLLANHTGALGGTSGGTTVNKGATLELGTGIAISNEPLSLTGGGANARGALNLRTGAAWNGGITIFNNEAYVEVTAESDVATINGQVSGDYLRKSGAGTLRLAGSQNNINAGAFVNKGKLQLAKTGGASAVDYELTIGEGVDAQGQAVVELQGSNQIADYAIVDVNTSGALDLNGFSDVVFLRSIQRGRVDTGAGKLRLNGMVIVYKAPVGYSEKRSFIVGNVELNATERKFYVETGAELQINGNLSDGGVASGLTLTGGGRLSLVGGNHTYSGLTRVSGASLDLSYGAQPGSTAAGTLVENEGTLSLWDEIIGTEALTLSIGSTNVPAVLLGHGTNSWAGPVNVTGACILYSYGSGKTTFKGSINGGGSVSTLGQGVIQFAGNSDNTFSGKLSAEGSLLELNKSGGATAVPGAIAIGTGEPALPAVVRLLANNQIVNSSLVQINRGGSLDLNNFSDAIGALELRPGNITMGSGLLTLLGDVKADASGGAAASHVYGSVALGGAVRSVTSTNGGSVAFHGVVSDGGGSGGLRFAGAGTHSLEGANTFTGPLTVESGTLIITHSLALGASAGGTTIQNGATLRVNGGLTIAGEALTMGGGAGVRPEFSQTSGNTEWSGPVTLASDATFNVVQGAAVNLSGVVSGPGLLVKEGAGGLTLSGSSANSFGGVTLRDGQLTLAKSGGIAVPRLLTMEDDIFSAAPTTVLLTLDNQIADTAPVTVGKGCVLDFAGHIDIVGALDGSGAINLGNGRITLNGVDGAHDFAGVISGSGSGTNLIKNGSGLQTLSGKNPYTGKTVVNAGTLLVNGEQMSSAVQVNNGATLGGRGSVGSVASAGGRIAPGPDANSPSYGELKTAGLNLSKGTFQAQLGGMTADTQHDQVMLNGLLILNGVTLDLSEHFTAAKGNQFTLINVAAGGAAMGTFSGLPDGASFTNASGSVFQITYFGGDGNDVVVTKISAGVPPHFASIALLGNGQVQLVGAGTPGVSYAVQAITNLATTNWLDLGVISADGSGKLTFTDESAASLPTRFYRLMAQ